MSTIKIDDLRFEFEINEVHYAYDPWTSWTELLAGNVFGLLADSQAEALSEKARIEATDKLAKRTRVVFGLPEEITDAACLSVAMAFMSFCEECKKKENSWLELLPLTDQASLQAKAEQSVQESSSS